MVQKMAITSPIPVLKGLIVDGTKGPTSVYVLGTILSNVRVLY